MDQIKDVDIKRVNGKIFKVSQVGFIKIIDSNSSPIHFTLLFMKLNVDKNTYNLKI
jgi:hypothetical protein